MGCIARRTHKQGSRQGSGPAAGQLELARSDVGQRLPLGRPWLSVALTGPLGDQYTWRSQGEGRQGPDPAQSRPSENRQAFLCQAGGGRIL
jgi:hypothetical protein